MPPSPLADAPDLNPQQAKSAVSQHAPDIELTTVCHRLALRTLLQSISSLADRTAVQSRTPWRANLATNLDHEISCTSRGCQRASRLPADWFDGDKHQWILGDMEDWDWREVALHGRLFAYVTEATALVETLFEVLFNGR